MPRNTKPLFGIPVWPIDRELIKKGVPNIQPWRSRSTPPASPASPAQCFISPDCLDVVGIYTLRLLHHSNITASHGLYHKIFILNTMKSLTCTGRGCLRSQAPSLVCLVPPPIVTLIPRHASCSSRSAKAQGRQAVFLRSLAFLRPANGHHLPDYLGQHLFSGQVRVSPARHEVVHADYSRTPHELVTYSRPLPVGT